MVLPVFRNVRNPHSLETSETAPAWLEAPDGQRRQELRRDWTQAPGQVTWSVVRSYCYVIITVSPQHSASREREILTRVIHLGPEMPQLWLEASQKTPVKLVSSCQTGPSEIVNMLIARIVTQSMT